MDLTFNERELAFRDELRAWFDAYDPGPEPEGDEDAHYAWRRNFQRDLANGGWAAVHWPVEYGGRGATLTESAIFYEELARSGSPLPANVLGLLLAGPTIMTWGTPEQKERYLTPILTAEEIWCQGFSEPNAGSDLASLKTRAVKLDDSRGVQSGNRTTRARPEQARQDAERAASSSGGRADAKREGDDWLVSGQKVWTSGAQYSRWCMLVARTDPDVPKHKGLTYFLMDMQQDAVQVRPLRQITGEREFNELFIDGARIPGENVLGGVGNGWKVALTTLMNERAGLAFFLQVRLRQTLDRLIDEAAGRGLLDDPIVADRLGELHLRAEVLRLTAYRGLTAIEKYGQPGPEGSLTKWMWSDTNQQLTQFAADLLGPSALQAGGRWAYELLRARGNSIEGGTTEVLKNIVAERVLGLPRAR